jgi:DNA-binding PadR family transcriptional regulator
MCSRRIVAEGTLLTPIAFEILLALADEDRHGYAILQDIVARTDGEFRPHAGSLYRALARLVGEGWVVELDERPDPSDDDGRRRYYRLTAAGRRVAAAEADRLAAQVRVARARKLLQRPGLS